METLRIKNFAGIKDVNIDIKEINVFIGPQGSGKSVIIKLLYFFRSFLYDIAHDLQDRPHFGYFEEEQKDVFLKYFAGSPLNNNFEIIYRIGSISITITNNENIQFHFSKFLQDYIESFNSIVNEAHLDEKKSMFNKYRYAEFKYHNEKPVYERRIESLALLQDVLLDEMQTSYGANNIFIPAGRTYFSSTQNSIFSSMKYNEVIDPFIIEFGAYYEKLRKNTVFRGDLNEITQTSSSSIRPEIKEFLKTANSILNSTYYREGREDFLKHFDDRTVNILNASSGQQEILPLIIILFQQFTDITIGNPTLCIEEPETHLFPSAQKKIVQLIARTFTHTSSYGKFLNDRKYYMQFFITTHSPYILTSFNNLLQAGRLAELKSDRIEEINKIVPKEEQINPKNFSAYYIENGEAKSLIDENTGLISQTELDAVSDEIVNEFSQLLDIEF